MKIAIYGIFKDRRCVYVGRTQNPKRREYTHRRVFGKDRKFKILKWVPFSDAATAEREMIAFYKSTGQADFNGRTNKATIARGVMVRIKPQNAKNMLELAATAQLTITALANHMLERYYKDYANNIKQFLSQASSDRTKDGSKSN